MGKYIQFSQIVLQLNVYQMIKSSSWIPIVKSWFMSQSSGIIFSKSEILILWEKEFCHLAWYHLKKDELCLFYQIILEMFRLFVLEICCCKWRFLIIP